MPPRWMQSKILKLKKQNRQAALRKPRSGGVDTSKIAAHEMFQNRNRVNTTQGRAGEMEPVLENTWMEDIPRTGSYRDYLERRERYIKLVNEHSLVIEEENEEPLKNRKIIPQDKDLLDYMFDVWQGVRLQGVNQYHTINYGVYTLYFQGDKFRFVIEDEKFRYISKLYVGRAAAEEAYNSKIKWEITRVK